MFFTVNKVEGYGMLNTYNDGEWLLFSRKAPVKRFSIVLFKVPGTGEYSIRRVIGLPGESVAVQEDELYVNGKVVSERALEVAKQKARDEQEIFTEAFSIKELTGDSSSSIPNDLFLMLGDNRPYSSDSRSYGLIPHEAIIGVAVNN